MARRKKKAYQWKGKYARKKNPLTALLDSYVARLGSVKYGPEKQFLNNKEFIFTQTSLGPDAGRHSYSSVHGNLLSLTFRADGADGLNAWTGRAARGSLKDICHTRGHLTSMESRQFTYHLICA